MVRLKFKAPGPATVFSIAAAPACVWIIVSSSRSTMRISALGVAILVPGLTNVAETGNVAAGKEKSAACVACHGWRDRHAHISGCRPMSVEVISGSRARCARPVLESGRVENLDPEFLSHYTHSFANTDQDDDKSIDRPCETRQAQTANHKNDKFDNTRNNGRTGTGPCHTHSMGFDKDNPFCTPGRTCPPVN